MVHIELTRASAYDLVGKPHFIPMKHGVAWLRNDLVNELENLKRGRETSLDYRGEVDGAPQLVLARSNADVISVQSLNGTLDAAGNTRWTWPPSVLPDRHAWIAYELMQVLLQRRGATGVIMMRPRGHESGGNQLGL